MSKLIKYPEVSLQNHNISSHSPIQLNASPLYPPRSMSKPPSHSFYIPPHLTSLKKTRYKSPESSANQSSNASPSPRRKYETNDVISYAKNALSYIKDDQKTNENPSHEYLKKIKNKMEYYKIKSKNLEKENLKLKEDIVKYSISDSSTISGSSERSEKSSSDESQMKEIEENLKSKFKAEILNLKKIICEKDKIISQLEIELQNKSVLGDHNGNIKNETQENDSLKGKINRQEYEKLEKQFGELEDMQNRLISENDALKRELKICNSTGDHLGLIYFANDIQKIKKDFSQVLNVLETLKLGKQVSLKLVLGLEDDDINRQFTAQQINQNISAIKFSLSKIREIIADFHAEQCGTHSCAMQ